jgi:hypothetical protein
MAIQEEFSPNLDTDEVRQFLLDLKTTDYDGPIDVKSGYFASNIRKPAGLPIEERAGGKSLSLFWAVREFYEAVEGNSPGQVVGNFDVIVPMEEQLAMTVTSVLLIKTGTTADAQKKIEAAFSKYTFPNDGDPTEFARRELANAGIGMDAFATTLTYSLRKMKRIEHDAQRKAALGLYNGTTRGEINEDGHTRPIHGEEGYFKERKIRCALVRRENVAPVPSKPKDSLHEVDDKRTIEQTVDDVTREEGRQLECNMDAPPRTWLIQTLFEWPEFKLITKPFDIVIGCVRVTLWLPVLQTRTGQSNLYGYTRAPRNTDKAVWGVVEHCFWEAALSAAVVGIASLNFYTALAAFKGIFSKCIYDHLKQLIPCLIPGLILKFETKPGDDWH